MNIYISHFFNWREVGCRVLQLSLSRFFPHLAEPPGQRTPLGVAVRFDPAPSRWLGHRGTLPLVSPTTAEKSIMTLDKCMDLGARLI